MISVKGIFSNLLREALLAAWAHKVTAVLVVVVVAAMTSGASISLGIALAHQRDVLATVDEAGSRAVVVTVASNTGVPADGALLDRLKGIDGIAWAAVVSAPRDVRNANVPGGTTVGLRDIFSYDYAPIGLSDVQLGSRESVLISREAAATLRFTDGAGVIADVQSGSTQYAVASIPELNWLQRFAPVAFRVMPEPTRVLPEMILVIAESNAEVAEVADFLGQLYVSDDEVTYGLEASTQLANLRTNVDSQLATFSRDVPLALVSSAGTLVGLILTGLAIMRRKDFGRRRALGAARWMIVFLVVTQAVALALAGVVLGSLLAVAAIAVVGHPLPSFEFMLAVAIYAIVISAVMSLLPALIASQRDPVKELRVP